MLRALRSWRQDRLLRGILKNSGYLFSSNTISVILGTLQGILVARLLGVENYGLVSGLVIDFASNVNRLLSFRMSETVVKYLGQALVEENKERAAAVAKAAGMVEGLTSVAAYLVLLALSPLAARYIAKDPQSAPLFAIYGLVILANLVYETSTGVLQATGRFDRIALINLGQSLITFTLIAIAFVGKGGLMGVLGAYLLGKSFAGLAILVAAARQLGRALGAGWWRAPLGQLTDWREMFGFSINTNLNGTVNLLVRDSELLLIGLLRSKAEVGYFRIARTVINLVMMPIEPFIGPTYTEITRTIARGEWAITRRLLKRVSSILGAWTLSTGLGLALLGWWLIPAVYGAGYAPAYPALLILLVGYGFANIFQWNRPLLLALGMPSFPLKVMALVGLAKTALSFTLVPVLGYLAEAALLSAYFIVHISIILAKGLKELKKRSSVVSRQSIVDNRQSSVVSQRSTVDIREAAVDNQQSAISNQKSKIIVCVSTSQIPSSTANSIQAMKACQALAQLGHEVHLLAPGRKSTPWEELAEQYGLKERFEVEWLPADACLKRYDFCLAAVRRARALKGDLLYAWPPQAALFGLLARLPVILEMHGPPEGKLGPAVFGLFLKLRPARKYGSAGNKRLLPITQALADLLEGQFGVHFASGEAVVAPNGVDLERYADLPAPAAARCALGLPETLTVGYTGHLYAGRGMGLLVELARRFPQVSFLWVGGRPENVAAWQRRLAEEKIENITLAGFVQNSRLPLYQAAAEILLMPYERQIAGSGGGDSAGYASPMKMFEYMACGRAIVSSDLPVIREVLDESNAVLCPPEDPEAWEHALQSLISDPARRERLARRAREAVERYTWIERARRALENF